MSKEELYIKFAEQIRNKMMEFETWYAENIFGASDDWKFNVRAVVTFEEIGDIYHRLEDELMELDE